MLKVYTAEEVAKMLKVHPRTVKDWINRGELSAYRLKRAWRITEEDLKEFLEKNRNRKPLKERCNGNKLHKRF